jgi:hypothetical protein
VKKFDFIPIWLKPRKSFIFYVSVDRIGTTAHGYQPRFVGVKIVRSSDLKVGGGCVSLCAERVSLADQLRLVFGFDLAMALCQVFRR